MPTNQFGAKKKTGYMPSFRALVFKETGAYKKTSFSKSGLDYRPITKAFKISKGGFRLRL
jgi:hypothetical protein